MKEGNEIKSKMKDKLKDIAKENMKSLTKDITIDRLKSKSSTTLKIMLCSMIIAVMSTGCSINKSDNTSETGNNVQSDHISESEENTQSDGTDKSAGSLDNGQDGVGNHAVKSYDGNNILYTYQNITLTLPEAWEGRYVITENEDQKGFTVLQKASNDKQEGWGFLFSVYASDMPYVDMPGGEALAYTKDKIYYFSTPTDVPYDYEDAEVTEDYQDMMQDFPFIEASVVIDEPGVHRNASEYVYPMSEYYPLTEDMLVNMSDNDLWLARNEIYARHGYHFKNPYLQLYFGRYAWYEDRGDDFSEDEFSQIEKDNIRLLQKMENDYADNHPYPKEEAVGREVSVDLTGNGRKNTILYQIKTDENDYEKALLTIDKTVYDLENDFDIYMDSPETEKFYITDISPYFDGLEIAIADYGPSDDPVTHFFIYNEKTGLKKIGSVPGFPMKQMGYQDGFVEGGVYGYGRGMTLDVHEYKVYYWYDYDNQKLVLQEGADSHYDLPRTHVLTADLPLHYTMDEASATFTLPKGSRTFFKQCIGSEWVLVHGPDGAEGYVHYTESRDGEIFPYLNEISMDAEQVFEGLLVYD